MSQLESRPGPSAPVLTDDGVQEMLALAERLREANGGVLDDAAIMAVSEATGAPPEYVRLAIRLRPQQQRRGLVDSVRDSFLSFEPDTRRHVVSSVAGAALGLTTSLADSTGDTQGLFGVLSILIVTGAIYNVAVSRDSKTAAFTGAIFAVVFFVLHALFNYLLKGPRIESFLLVPTVLGCALLALLVHKVVDRHRNKLGLNDPVTERQQLLRQLVELQDRLKSGEQAMTFVSVDVVGSTRMKQIADPLSVEFTFTEYHRFVEMIAHRYGGRVHSTAGDGITLAFDHPQMAFGAARTLQTGIIELNTFRNKIGAPIVLRCGIHTGTVLAPDATDVKTINFASVIDIAAHLQKACPPGGVAISEAAAQHLPGGTRAFGDERVQVDSTAAYVWKPRALGAPAPSGGPPPLPNQATS